MDFFPKIVFTHPPSFLASGLKLLVLEPLRPCSLSLSWRYHRQAGRCTRVVGGMVTQIFVTKKFRTVRKIDNIDFYLHC